MKLQTINAWHKTLGMVATLFVLLLCITGFFLLHTDAFELQEKKVESAWLLDWYGIGPEGPPVSFEAGGKWVTRIDDLIFLDTRLLESGNKSLKGLLSQDELYIVAYHNSIDLLTAYGERIERIEGIHGLPRGIEKLGSDSSGRIIIQADGGLYSSDSDLVAWKKTDALNVSWSEQASAPDELVQQLLQVYRGNGLPLERLLLDLHSGRMLGTAGILIIDISVLIFLALSITGWWSWFKRRAIQKELGEE